VKRVRRVIQILSVVIRRAKRVHAKPLKRLCPAILRCVNGQRLSGILAVRLGGGDQSQSLKSKPEMANGKTAESKGVIPLNRPSLIGGGRNATGTTRFVDHGCVRAFGGEGRMSSSRRSADGI